MLPPVFFRPALPVVGMDRGGSWGSGGGGGGGFVSSSSSRPLAANAGGRRLSWACQTLATSQVLVGIALVSLSLGMLFGATHTDGLLSGVLLLGLGVLGVLAARRRSRAALQLHVVGSVLALMLVFQFTSQVREGPSTYLGGPIGGRPPFRPRQLLAGCLAAPLLRVAGHTLGGRRG